MGAPVMTKISGYTRRCLSGSLSDAGSTPAASSRRRARLPSSGAGPFASPGPSHHRKKKTAAMMGSTVETRAAHQFADAQRRRQRPTQRSHHPASRIPHPDAASRTPTPHPLRMPQRQTWPISRWSITRHTPPRRTTTKIDEGPPCQPIMPTSTTRASSPSRTPSPTGHSPPPHSPGTYRDAAPTWKVQPDSGLPSENGPPSELT